MVSASLRKSVTDLTRRRARAFFAVATLGFAVAGIAFFAIPTLIDRSMQREVRADRLADVALTMRPLQLSDARLRALAALPNIAAVDARNSVETRVLVGERRAAARVIGVRDFARQRVDVVRVDSGALPGRGEVLVDVQDANTDRYGGKAGDTLTAVGGQRLRISGKARNIDGGEQVQDDSVIVLYAPAATVAALSGERGYNRLALRLRDTSSAAAATTIRDVRRYLSGVPGFQGFANLPQVRSPGDWPGKDETRKFTQLLSVITLLALLSALVLISNTMTTLVAEQTGEIGIMRAVGARRRQVARVYIRTALLLGALGAVVGTALGIALSNLAASYFGSTFWAVDVGFGVDVPLLLVSMAVGLIAPPLAALPAIRRGTRTDLRQALESTGSVVGGQTAFDRALRHVGFLPRTMQLGLRNVGRRKRRGFATTLIVALAVGNLLAVLAIAAAAGDTTRSSWNDHQEDVRIWTAGRLPFDQRAERAIRAMPGVGEVQPALTNDVTLAGEDAVVWGMPVRSLFRYRISSGRWYSAAEEQARERVVVVERNLARITGVGVGERITLSTAAGRARFRVVGIAGNQQEDGTALFVPLATVRSLLGQPTGATAYWVKMTSPDHALVDRTTTRLEDRLAALGYDVGSQIKYVAARDEEAANSTVTTSIAVLGFLVVAISMVGLANAMTTSVLERTRELGVMRCIGARARDVRRIFATEGVVLALAGWLLGIPVGYALDRAIVGLVRDVANIDLPVMFPAFNVVLALLGTVVLALAITALPIRRAVRYRPGDALRYS